MTNHPNRSRRSPLQIFEVPAGLYVGRSAPDGATLCTVTVRDGAIKIGGASRSYTAVRGPRGWVWTGPFGCRASTEMQRHLSRLAARS